MPQVKMLSRREKIFYQQCDKYDHFVYRVEFLRLASNLPSHSSQVRLDELWISTYNPQSVSDSRGDNDNKVPKAFSDFANCQVSKDALTSVLKAIKANHISVPEKKWRFLCISARPN